MKKIKLRWNGLGWKNQFQADVFLYDEKGCLLFQGRTISGECYIWIQPEKVYKVLSISEGEFFQKVFYVDKCKSVYTFSFSQSIYQKESTHLYTFHLTDFYYPDLPIEKGEIIFG